MARVCKMGGCFSAVFLLLTMCTTSVIANDNTGLVIEEKRNANVGLTIDEQIVEIKKEMVLLGREIKVLEDLFLYPPETKVSLYLSMDVGKLFILKSIDLIIDDELVAEYLYSGREESGLKKGAAHQIYIGNYMPGQYSLRLVMKGIGPHGRFYKRAVGKTFTKEERAKVMQVVIYDDIRRQQPAFLLGDVSLCKACQ